MNIAANIIILCATIGLLILGGFLVYQNKIAGGSAILGFAVIFCFFIICARFKHFEGFGIKAEMWEDTQVEAAQLIDRLSLLSESTAQQTGLIASRLGLWSSGFTNPELSQLLTQTEKMLLAANTPKAKSDEIKAPIIERIKWNYIFTARNLVNKVFNNELLSLDNKIIKANENEREALRSNLIQIRDLRTQVGKIDVKQLAEMNTLESVISIVRTAPDFDEKKVLLISLSELDNDLQYFSSNFKLKRNIDLRQLYKEE